MPVDWVAETMLRIGDSAPAGKAFHLTHPEPVRFRWLLETSCRILGVEAMKLVDPSVAHSLFADPSLVHDDAVLRELQTRFNDWLSMYLPYLWEEPAFDSTNVRQTLHDSYVPPRRIDEDFLRVLLHYAVTNRFKVQTVN